MGSNRFAMVPKYVLVGVALALGSASASKTVAGWSIPETWEVGSDYVVVGGASASSYAGYIFPGPSPTSAKSVAYASPAGYYCEAKNYDMNYGIFATQACANTGRSLSRSATRRETPRWRTVKWSRRCHADVSRCAALWLVPPPRSKRLSPTVSRIHRPAAT